MGFRCHGYTVHVVPKRIKQLPRLGIALVAIAFIAPIAAFGAFYYLSAANQIVPGLNGCRFVRDRTPQIDCYSRQFAALVKEQGLKKAFATVDREAQKSTTLGADCHLAWHPPGEKAGRTAVKKGTPFEYISARTTCQKGYAHGYTIGYLDSIGTDGAATDIATVMAEECSHHSDIDTILNCTHSFGHVIGRQHKDSVAEATSQCNEADYSILPDDAKEADDQMIIGSVVTGARFQCMYGMYMEYGMLDLAKDNPPLNNCRNATNPIARRACYSYLPARVGALRGTLVAAARSCESHAPAGDMRDACVAYFSFGLDKPERCKLFPVATQRERCRQILVGRTGASQVS